MFHIFGTFSTMVFEMYKQKVVPWKYFQKKLVFPIKKISYEKHSRSTIEISGIELVVGCHHLSQLVEQTLGLAQNR